MTILLQRNNAVYQPGVEDFAFAIAPDLTRIDIRLQSDVWPEDGDCFCLRLDWADGSSSNTYCSGGGVVLGKDGLPSGEDFVCTFSNTKPSGVTAGSAHLQVFQRIRTSVLVEGF